MIKLSEVSREQARQTCLVVAGVLLLIAAWSFNRGSLTLSEIFGTLGLILILTGFFIAPLARRFHVVWMTFALALGYLNSRILLTTVFFFMFVPYGFISRLVGRNPLLRRGAKRETYWQTKENTRQSKEQFERMF